MLETLSPLGPLGHPTELLEVSSPLNGLGKLVDKSPITMEMKVMLGLLHLSDPLPSGEASS